MGSVLPKFKINWSQTKVLVQRKSTKLGWFDTCRRFTFTQRQSLRFLVIFRIANSRQTLNVVEVALSQLGLYYRISTAVMINGISIAQCSNTFSIFSNIKSQGWRRHVGSAGAIKCLSSLMDAIYCSGTSKKLPTTPITCAILICLWPLPEWLPGPSHSMASLETGEHLRDLCTEALELPSEHNVHEPREEDLSEQPNLGSSPVQTGRA